MKRVTSWIVVSLIGVLLAGCSAIETPPAVIASPTISASPTQMPPTPSPTPTPTDAPRADVELSLPDTSWTFWDPNVREQQLQAVAGQPGIYTAITLDQNHVRLIYNPSQLSQEEAVQVFESTTGYQVKVID